MQTFEIKRDSTWPSLDARLNLDLLTGLTGCTVQFRMLSQNGDLIIMGDMEIIDEVTQHVRYTWQSGDTGTAGNYWAEVWTVLSTGEMVKLPINEYINIVIYEDKQA